MLYFKKKKKKLMSLQIDSEELFVRQKSFLTTAENYKSVKLNTSLVDDNKYLKS